MNEPYASIRPLAAQHFDWFNERKRFTMARLFDSLSAAPVVLEVGSWVGDSACWFAGRGAARVYCVDTWAGPVDSHRYMLDSLYRQFLSNVIHAGKTDVVVPIRMSSTEATMSLNVSADLIYLDGDHSALGAYQDVMAWSRHASPGAVICGDDWSWVTVQNGVNQAASELGRKIEHDGDTWFFTRQT